MANKKIKIEDPQPIIDQPVPTDYLKSEIDLILPLFRCCQTSQQQNQVIGFYKKYVNKKYAGGTGCQGCGNSFFSLFKETRDWVAKNAPLFIN